jgi:hypothetical protein
MASRGVTLEGQAEAPPALTAAPQHKVHQKILRPPPTPSNKYDARFRSLRNTFQSEIYYLLICRLLNGTISTNDRKPGRYRARLYLRYEPLSFFISFSFLNVLQLIELFRMLASSDASKWTQEITILFMKALTSNYLRVVLATIQFRTFRFPVCALKT